MNHSHSRNAPVSVSPADFTDPGLYLVFENDRRLDLTRPLIKRTTDRFLSDPLLIPEHVKKAADYAPCEVCPEKDRAVICHGILPTLPFVERIDEYLSSDYVTAVYIEQQGHPMTVVHTDMQQALVFVSILSLIEYCEVGRKYSRYFRGVNPLEPTERIAEKILQNLHIEFQGNLEKMLTVLGTMESELAITTSCEVKRLKLISDKDAFLNAFVNTQATATFLVYEVRNRLAALGGQRQPG